MPATTAFTSDTMTWVQDTVKQDDPAILAIPPSAVNFSRLEPMSQPISAIQGITPLLGSIPTPATIQ